MYINAKTVEVDPKDRQNPDVVEYKDIELSVSASKRNSGKVDFYFDYELIDTTVGMFMIFLCVFRGLLETGDHNSLHLHLKKEC
jgi:hypothetical protein